LTSEQYIDFNYFGYKDYILKDWMNPHV